MPLLQLKTQIKTTHTTAVAASLMVSLSSVALFLSWGMMAVVGVNKVVTTQIHENSTDQRIQMTEDTYSVEYDIPSHLNKEHRQPNKFFSGRKISIVRKDGKPFSYPETIVLSKRDRVTKKMLNQKSLKVLKKKISSFSVDVAPEVQGGFYTFDFMVGGIQYLAPIAIEEDVVAGDGGGGGMEQIGEIDPSMIRLNCDADCFWELASTVSPLDERYGYILATKKVVQTTDGWKTSQVYDIDAITKEPRTHRYAGDPQFDFTPEGNLVIASLQSPNEIGSFLEGGIYIETQPLRQPPELEQIVLYDQPWQNNDFRIQFDYEKFVIDKNPSSDYLGNIYVYVNGLLYPNGEWGKGLYIYKKENNHKWLREVEINAQVQSMAVWPEGELYLAYLHGESSQDTFANKNEVSVFPRILKSLDGGETFTIKDIFRHDMEIPYECQAGYLCYCNWARVSLASDRGDDVYLGPELAMDNQGTLYALWSMHEKCIEKENLEYGSYGYDFDIFLSKSSDKGENWSRPVRINDDIYDGDQTFPSIAIADDNTIYAAFLDHRDNQHLGVFDVYIAESTDGGMTFSKNEKVNDLTITNNVGGRQPGDYLDMLSAGKNFVYVAHPCEQSEIPGNFHPSETCIRKFSRPLQLSGRQKVVFTQPSTGEYFSDFGFFEVFITDNSEINNIELYIDGDTLLNEVGRLYSPRISRYGLLGKFTDISNGQHAIIARVYDQQGNIFNSSPLTLTIDKTPPTIILESPSGGEVISGSQVSVRALAQDNLEINSVGFYLDGQQLHWDNWEPYEFIWNSTLISDGPHIFKAQAWDRAQNNTFSKEVQFIVNNKIFLRGDSNRDGVLNISDSINTLGFLFQGSPADLKCQDAADANDDGKIDISDAVFILKYLFNQEVNTQVIPQPFPNAGIDPTQDGLGCQL